MSSSAFLFAECFPELSRAEQKLLAFSARELSFGKNDIVFSEGCETGFLDWLIEGRVKLFKNSMSGKSIVLHVVSAGHFLDHSMFFGELAFMSAMALTSCRVLRIDAKVLQQIIFQNAPFSVHVLRAVAARQRMFANKITASQGKISVRRRVAGWLVHKTRVNKTNTLEDNVTREVLAGMLGLSRESLSRQLRVFVEEQIIRLEKKAIVVLDNEALQRCLKE